MSTNDIWSLTQAIFLAVGGAGAIIFGLSSFLSKVWAERILEKEKQAYTKELEDIRHRSSELITQLQASVDRAQYVNRATFDREFDTYRETWGKVVDLRAAVTSLRPIMDYVDPKQTEEDRKIERLKRFQESLSPFWEVYEKNRPFLPEKIYAACSDLVDLTHGEAVGYRYGSQREEGLKYWDNAKKAHGEILKGCDRISDLIRERLGELASFPGHTKPKGNA